MIRKFYQMKVFVNMEISLTSKNYQMKDPPVLRRTLPYYEAIFYETFLGKTTEILGEDKFSESYQLPY